MASKKATTAEEIIQLYDRGFSSIEEFAEIAMALVNSDLSEAEWDKLEESGYSSLILDDPWFVEVYDGPWPWK